MPSMSVNTDGRGPSAGQMPKAAPSAKGPLRWQALIVLCILGGCGLLSPEDERVPSVLEHLNLDLPFQFHAPDTVVAGTEFGVSLRTYLGGCSEPGSVKVEVSGLVAILSPEDIRASGRDVCPLGIRNFTYDLDLRFDGPGTGSIRVRGRVKPSGDDVEKVVPIVVVPGPVPIR